MCQNILTISYASLNNSDEFYAKEVNLLLAYTLRESPLWWCCSLPCSSVHSLEQFCDLIESTFHDFDPKPVDKNLLEQWKAPQESPDDFWQCFRVLHFQALKSQMC